MSSIGWRRLFPWATLSVSLAFILVLSGCKRAPVSATRFVPDDEAMARAKAEHRDPQEVRKAFYYTATEHENFFRGMDVIAAYPPEGGLPDQLLAPGTLRGPRPVFDPVSTSNEILGRNTWMLWCGGNERFWDWLANNSLGFMDLLKVIDSRNRANRWRDAGMVNEPGMRAAGRPDEFGLWLDVPDADYYQTAARDHLLPPRAPDDPAIPAGSPDAKSLQHFADIYGWSTGVVGLRLFKNPAFKGDAVKQWKRQIGPDGVAAAYYNEAKFFSDPQLIRPYRVGMSCAFCHTSAHPLEAPFDPAQPRWENLSGAIGSQYLRIRSVFGNLLQPDNYVYHLLDSQPPGTIDTSLIASDNINNPNTMNAIFGVPQRVQRAYANPREWLNAAAQKMPSLSKQETQPYEQPRHVPRILLDGADSIGVYGALARVYLNIGTFSEQWTRLHTPLVGFIPPAAVRADPGTHYEVTQAPFQLADCQEHSIYWQATQDRVEALRDYFLKITPSMPLLSAAGGSEPRVRVQVDRLSHGRQVFAANCIVCHSSIQPENNPRDLFESDPADLLHQHPPTAPVRDKVLAYEDKYKAIIAKRRDRVAGYERDQELWDHDPGQWLRDPDYIAWSKAIVETPEFWRNNYLSTDFRLPITYVGTNPGRALGTNGMTGRMWQDFSSVSYRHLPSVGELSFFDPFTGRDESFTPRHAVPAGVPWGGGGPGYIRPASLISVWATAPFLHNNSLGLFNNDPSVKGRLAAFDDAIRKLLWPERRLESSSYNGATAARLHRDHGLIWRTPAVTYLNLPAKDVPAALSKLPAGMRYLLPYLAGLQWFGRVPWLPSAGLFVVAFIIFLCGSGKLSTRIWGYAALVGGLVVGFILYFAVGGLGDAHIGPIPQGTPVNLLANLNPDADPSDLKAALTTTLDTLADIDSRHLSEADAQELMRTKVAPALLKVSKCPDFVMDKGHYYPWFQDMSDDDKYAVIELLKTF